MMPWLHSLTWHDQLAMPFWGAGQAPVASFLLKKIPQGATHKRGCVSSTLRASGKFVQNVKCAQQQRRRLSEQQAHNRADE